jgi:hypothetical protein
MNVDLILDIVFPLSGFLIGWGIGTLVGDWLFRSMK